MIVKKEYRQSSVFIYQKAKAGQTVCGDTYFVEETDEHLVVAIADGLGSGPGAYEAAQHATGCFSEHLHLEVEELLTLCNERLRGTRGAVVSVMKLSFLASTIAYTGLGNVQFILCSDGKKAVHPYSKPGYLSGKPVKAIREEFPVQKGSTFMMFSDGFISKSPLNPISLNWNHIFQNPEKWMKQADQFNQMNDDVTIIVGKILR